MNIHVKCITNDEYRRLEEGLDTVEGFDNSTEYPILVIPRDSSINRGDLIGIQTTLNNNGFNPYLNPRIAPRILLVQVMCFVTPGQWYRFGVMLMQVRLIDLSECEQIFNEFDAALRAMEKRAAK